MHAGSSGERRAPSFRKGWQGSATCDCDNSKQFLNCKGVPMLAYPTPARISHRPADARSDERNSLQRYGFYGTHTIHPWALQ